MDATVMLNSLKIDLGISTSAYDSRLSQYLAAAQEYIAAEGITLQADSLSDLNLVVMYAAWLWRKRESGEGMPRMLRYNLNNRLFSEKVSANG